VAVYNQQKAAELKFNERKAELIKENLDLKDRTEGLSEIVEQKKEAVALLENSRKAMEERIADFQEEMTALEKKYEDQLLELKEENTSLFQRIEDLENRPLSSHIQAAIAQEKSEKLKSFLAQVISNINIIEKGGDIELEPIIVTKKDGTLQKNTPSKSFYGDVQKEPVISSEQIGKVISVDEKYSLVVFDLGRKDGVERGGQCEISKDEKRIATAEIISARYRVAAAFVYEVEYGHSIRDIQKGDDVTIIE
jgi:hypothetical protein